jgi:hypothetical protein
MEADTQPHSLRAPSSEPSLPRRDSAEDADSSLTRKRPRLDSGSRASLPMSTDQPLPPEAKTPPSSPIESTLLSNIPSPTKPSQVTINTRIAPASDTIDTSVTIDSVAISSIRTSSLTQAESTQEIMDAEDGNNSKDDPDSRTLSARSSPLVEVQYEADTSDLYASTNEGIVNAFPVDLLDHWTGETPSEILLELIRQLDEGKYHVEFSFLFPFLFFSFIFSLRQDFGTLC